LPKNQIVQLGLRQIRDTPLFAQSTDESIRIGDSRSQLDGFGRSRFDLGVPPGLGVLKDRCRTWAFRSSKKDQSVRIRIIEWVGGCSLFDSGQQLAELGTGHGNIRILERL